MKDAENSLKQINSADLASQFRLVFRPIVKKKKKKKKKTGRIVFA